MRAPSSSIEISSEHPLLDRECRPFPTFEETRATAEGGNLEAIEVCRRQNLPTNPPKYALASLRVVPDWLAAAWPYTWRMNLRDLVQLL